MKTILRTLTLLALFAGVPNWPAAAAQKTWTAATDTLWSTAGNWSPTGSPGTGDNVLFTNTAAALSPGIGSVNNVVDAGFANSINSLAFMNTNGYHNTSLVNPLTVVSSSASDVAFIADDGSPSILFVGSGQADGTAASVYATIAGSSLVVSNGNANLSVMQINGSDSAGYRATLDLTGLNSFACTVSNVQVGVDAGTVNITRPHGTLLLAKTNVLTAAQILVADAYNNGSGQTCFLRLGQSNLLQVGTLRVGLRKMHGTMNFNAGLSAPKAVFRDPAGTGRENAWEIGDTTGAGGSSSQSTGIMDLTGGTVDALVDRLTVGRGQDADGQGDGTGTLTFGGGAIDANTLELGIQQFAGRSVGHGTLNVNNDVGVGPALLTVHNDVTLATQINASTDTSGGTTAAINLNGGTMTVAGNINDGAGLSTISISNGGKLDLQPSGDGTAGNISVDILNLGSGILTNYGTLSVSNINLVAPATQFTVYPGQTLAPIAVGTLGTLTVTGDLKLRGTTAIDINKVSGVTSSDTVAVTGTADLGGTLTVTLSGTDSLTAGDTFTVLSAAHRLNSFGTVNLPALDPGLSWLNKITVDGTIQVVSGTVAPTFVTQPAPTSISCFADARMSFRPVVESTSAIDYRWRINSVDVPGATSSSVSIAALGLSAGNTYTLTLFASNELGTATSDPVTLTVLTNLPVAGYYYVDSFSRTGVLNGTSPDLTNTGAATWLAATNFLTDGSELVYPPAGAQGYLPFSPQWGHVYILTADINGTNPSTEWQALGFANSPQVSSGGFYVGSTGFLLVRADHSQGYSFINGLGSAQSFPIFDTNGPSTFSVVLDTTTGDSGANTGWTLYCIENGVLVTTTVYGANPSVQYVGLGGSTTAAGLFDNFSFSDSLPLNCAAAIAAQPASTTVYTHADATFTASATGDAPISYQWKRGTTVLSGATNSTLTLTNVAVSDAGSYSVVVSNHCGMATSIGAVLTVLLPPPQYDLYYDDFAAADSTPLAGRAPLINRLNNVWNADSRLMMESNVLYCPPGGANESAYLPFVPAWGHIYVLSADINPLVNSGEWLDLGFTPDADVNKLAPELGGGPWMLQRANRGGSYLFSEGFGVAGSGDGGNAVGPTTWKIVLDTTTGDTNANAGWTAMLVEGLPNSFGKIVASYVYTSFNPLVFYVTLGNESSVGISGTFDNFRLTDSIEPNVVTIQRSGSNVILTWPRGTLLEAPTVTGPWTTNNAVSPYTVAPTAAQRFYRTQVQ